MRVSLLCVFFVTSHFVVFGQTFPPVTGFYTGVTALTEYRQTLNENLPAETFSFGGSLIPGYRFNRSFSLELPLSFTVHTTHQDAVSPDLPDSWLSGQGDLRINYHLANGYLLSPYLKVQPYLGAGGGMRYHIPETGFTLPESPVYRIPVYAGFNWNVSNNWIVRLEAGHVVSIGHHDQHQYARVGVQYRFGRRDKVLPAPFEYPDRDGDGVPDHVDACPDIPGLPEFDGCPDSDGDGVPDHLDECPHEPGPAYNAGCPDPYAADRDGDGIPDLIDACPDVPGEWRFQGCPDSDGDGIPDHLDKCPDQPGPAHTQGCPDTDGDGIPDHEDLCPFEPGPASNHGCPVLNDNWRKIVELAGQPILFATGSYTVSAAQLRRINELAALLTHEEGYTLIIEGHTDHTGNIENNKILSELRAREVLEALTKAGVSETGIYVRGFGDFHPADEGKSAESLRKNRRVEIRVIKG